MKLETWKQISSLIASRDDVVLLAKQFNVSYETVFSIYKLKYQQQIIQTASFHMKAMNEYYARYLKEKQEYLAKWPLADEAAAASRPLHRILVNIAEEVSFSPNLLARNILKLYLESKYTDSYVSSVSGGAGSRPPPNAAAAATDATEDPYANGTENHSNKSLPLDSGKVATAANSISTPGNSGNGTEKKTLDKLINDCMKSVDLIEDKFLRQEVQQCVLSDDSYSPFVDRIRHLIGLEYEYRLKASLENRYIPFISEETLSQMGYPKTPDAKLEVPALVNGFVIHWIESKASFGDEYSHKKYLRDQYWGYRNRYGPGLIIYWFGFIDELGQEYPNDFLILDNFPANIKIEV